MILLIIMLVWLKKFKSLIFGGTKGIGSVIKYNLETRGDFVTSCSRGENFSNEHIQSSIEKFDIKTLKHKFDYLIFAHRYRGTSSIKDYEISVEAVNKLLEKSYHFLNNNGSIVILGSNAYGYMFEEQSPSYHYTRGALVSLTKYHSVKLGEFGIRCNLINPGTIIKPENRDYYSSNTSKREYIENLTPLKRMGTAQDIADLVMFLCSSNSSFITGQVISVDGGISLVSQETVGKLILNKGKRN